MALKIKIQQTGYNLQRMKEKILMKQSMNSQGINSGIYRGVGTGEAGEARASPDFRG